MVDALVVPVGGGGMVAGIAITVKVRKQLLEDSPLQQRILFYIIIHCGIQPFLQIAVPCHYSLALKMEVPSLPHYPFHFTTQKQLQ